jgi:phosphatidylglycerol lysyltransferase
VLNLASLLSGALPARVALLRAIFPLEFLRLSRSLTLLIGYALVLSSINIYKRKRLAFVVVGVLSAFSIVFHLTKGIDYEEAAFSLVLLGLLVATRDEFVVRSGPPDWRSAVVRLGVSAAVVLGYGAAGFWITPGTSHRRWFLDSLDLLITTTALYTGYTLFRPALYRLRTVPHERARGAEILERHGRAALDYFKIWPDKSMFFSPSRESFLAYRVAGGFAVVLGDPVGPEAEIDTVLQEFTAFCDRSDWRMALYQTLPDFLPIYHCQGFRRLKIGDDAIVNLRAFGLEGAARKDLRHPVRRLESHGVTTVLHEPPLPDRLVDDLRSVSDDWLRIPGRRERRFTLGCFDAGYVRSTPVFTAVDAAGRVLAFANVVRSYRRGEATIDLMRRRAGAPNGIMDYLLVKLLLLDKERGYERFNLGMAPMAGFSGDERASPEERAVHAFVQQLNFFFSYKGLRAYKAKFTSTWEPRYVMFRHVLDLPRLAVALARVSERPA